MKQRTALAIGLPAAAVLGVVSSLLIIDYVRVLRQTPIDKANIEQLEARVEEDPALGPELRAELDRIREVSLQRDARHQVQSWGVIISAIVFLTAAKWYYSLFPRCAPSLDTVVHIKVDRPDRAEKRTIATSGQPHHPSAGHGITESTADSIDLSVVEGIVDRCGRGAEAAIPIIQGIQSHYRYLPDEALMRVCEMTEITPAQIAGVSTFYAHFRRSPVGEHIVKVCHGTACHVAGARVISDEIRRHLGIAENEDTDAQRMFTVDEVACVGCCSLAPVIMLDEVTSGGLTPATACDVLESVRTGAPV